MSTLQPTLPETSAKVERYHWQPQGVAVPIRHVPVLRLCVDMTYQRERFCEGKVLGIAAAWNNGAAGVLTVSQRADGSYYVIDGNHRREAALRRGDIPTLPCRVVTGLDLAGEASLFRSLNMYRTNVSAYTKYRSALVAGDETVTGCDAMLHRLGLKIGQDADCPAIVAFPQALVQRFKADSVACESALIMVTYMIGEREQITKDLHAGTFYILRRCDRDKAHAMAPRVLSAGGKPTLLQAINATVCQLGSVRSHERVAAIGILSVLNRRVKHPLTLEE